VPLSFHPGQEGRFEGRAIVFDGAEDYHARINDPSLNIDDRCILVIRGAGPLGWPGSAEVVNMQPPDALIRPGSPACPPSVTGGSRGPRPALRLFTPRPKARRGMTLAPATRYRDVARRSPPRDNH
jgi:xylonate dehydratase